MNTSIRTNLLVYIPLLFAHVALIWLLPYFPTQDGPCHIYNLVILRDLLHGGKEWGDFFTYSLHPVPNYGFTLIAYPLINFFSPLVVERIFLSIYVLLLGMSAPLFLKAFDRPIFPFSYLVFPVIFNSCLLMGFFSYVITIPLFILSFSLAWKIRNCSYFCRFACFNLSGIVLFYFHLIPSVFFMLSLISISLAEDGDYKSKIRRLLLLLLTVSPFLVNIIFYLKQGSNKDLTDLSYLLSLSRISDLLGDLFSFSTADLSVWQLVPGSVFKLLVIVMLYSSVKEIWFTNKIDHDAKGPIKVLGMTISALTLIYLIAPNEFGDGAYLNQRFPWVILLVLLPLVRLPKAAAFQRCGTAIVAGCATIFFAFNAALLWEENVKIGKALSGLHTDIPKGSLLMAYKTKSPDRGRVDTLLHVASYYGLFKECVDVGNYEASFNYFPIRFKQGGASFPPQWQISYAPEKISLREYPSVHYLIGWEVGDKDLAKLSDCYHIVCNDGPLTVWRRN